MLLLLLLLTRSSSPMTNDLLTRLVGRDGHGVDKGGEGQALAQSERHHGAGGQEGMCSDMHRGRLQRISGGVMKHSSRVEM